MLRSNWTIADVLAEKPCLTERQIRRYFGSKVSLTLVDILQLPFLPPEDKIWMACRSSALPASVLESWKTAVLTRVITTHALTCGISTVEQWARNWLSGRDRTARKAAEAARTARTTGTAKATRAAQTAWAAEAARTAEAAQTAWAAWAIRAAWATHVIEAARAAEAAEATQTAWVTQVVKAIEAERAAEAAEYVVQIRELLTLLAGDNHAAL